MRDHTREDDTVIVSSRSAPAAGVDLEQTVITSRGVPEPETTLAAVPIPAAAPLAFRIGESAAVVLDRPCTVGRSPSASRIATGALPRLVRVASPSREVSATHLEVRQVGSTVVVTDLRSTNGSVVMLPGSAPLKLRQGESVVVSPGTLVDIGDGNVIEILAGEPAPGAHP